MVTGTVWGPSNKQNFPGGGGGHSREVYVEPCRRDLQPRTCLRQKLLISSPCIRQETLLSDLDLFCFGYRIKHF